jgi:phosphoserine phosphatase
MGTTVDLRHGTSYDGRLTYVPPTGEARYQALVDYADGRGLSLSESVAYADSASDLPMLEAVGFPVAVNPETKLATIARKRGWLIEDFRKSGGAPRKLLPIAPMRDRAEDGITHLLQNALNRTSEKSTR